MYSKSDKDSKITEMYSEGLPYSEIAKELGVSFSKISKVIKKNFLLNRKPVYMKAQVDSITSEFICSYTSNKVPLYKLCSYFKIPYQKAVDILRKADIHVKKGVDFRYKTLSAVKEQQVINMYKKGDNLDKICELFGISNKAIFKILKRLSIEKRIKKNGNLAKELTEDQKTLIVAQAKNGLNEDDIIKNSKEKISRKKVNQFLKDYFKPKSSDPIYLYNLRCHPDVAAKKISEMKKKQLDKKSGENSCCYGKPSPRGSGNGWKGWYKDFYFRSLRELNYMIYLDEESIRWKTGETENFCIEYLSHEGKKRTYRPDFFVDNKKLVEIKPEKLQKTLNIMVKTAAAIKKCEEWGLIYEITDFKIDPIKIEKALNEGLIKFARDYEKRFRKYITKNIPIETKPS